MLQDLLDRLFLGMGPVPSDAALITATIKAGADNLASFCRGRQVNFQDVLLSSVADIIGPKFELSCNGICISASCASSSRFPAGPLTATAKGCLSEREQPHCC
jgi:hypothetical protein